MPPTPPSSTAGGADGPRIDLDEMRGLLRGVIDPELGSDIVDLGMVRDVTADDDGHVVVTIALTTSGCPLRAQIQRDIRTRLGSVPGVADVRLEWTEMTDEQKSSAMAKARFNVSQREEETNVAPTTKVILVASGKGGVGKSSVTVNLATAMAARGLKVGVLDADVWGFSVPRMLGVEGRLAGSEEGGRKMMVPHSKRVGDGELRITSMGFLVEDEASALMWRGLMLNRGVQHFLQDVAWGDDLDYLLVDMPPGTGDVQMGVAKMIPRAEVLVVTTPALAAQKVAERAVSMSRKSYLRVAGIVENMSAFTCDHGESYALFGSGGGAALAESSGAPLLAEIPLEPEVVSGGDTGQPAALGDGPAAEAFRALAEVVVTEAVPPLAMAGCTARMLDAAVAALDEADAAEETPSETAVDVPTPG
ncbi:Mrp/NBP35 family ATP-binding protein [Iamia majanohamensis]|uniref:Iron-sulfur cluster carrier protein n=1 Tax=Iamia majanohamensis TaxID=467976 RepID=A0AAE9Y923_9ACTN|nr:Mrp/NBP35 family ATP-binding protein [Iamia majanohamensis]WCO66569.1 Mrp/NBP35 family ATP-binding protein [Iamia majanohamensis]